MPVGESAVLSAHDTRTRTVRAVTDCELCYITREAVRGVCDEYIELQARLQRYVTHPKSLNQCGKDVIPDHARDGDNLLGVVGRRYMHIGQLRLTKKAIRKIGMNSRHDVRRHADGFKAAMQAEDLRNALETAAAGLRSGEAPAVSGGGSPPNGGPARRGEMGVAEGQLRAVQEALERQTGMLQQILEQQHRR